MDEKYQAVHKNVLEFLEEIIQKAGTFEPETVVAEEEQLDAPLKELENSLITHTN